MISAKNKIHHEHTLSVATFPKYAEAEAAFKKLETNAFPTQYVSIVADGLTLLRTHPARLVMVKYLVTAAVSGMVTGAITLGIFYVLEIIVPAVSGMMMMLQGGALGLLAGVLLGLAMFYLFSDNRRPKNQQFIEGMFFDLVVHEQYAGTAQQILSESNINKIKKDSATKRLETAATT